MATKSVKTARPDPKTQKTTAPKVSRARKPAVDSSPTDGDIRTQPSYERIAARAYELWCSRGYDHGHDVEDWLAAEREMIDPQGSTGSAS